MLAIRMQRTGRKGHAQFRLIVQDAHRTATSGRVVALLGSYNPHTKEVNIDKEKVSFYLDHGAQPSPRMVRLLSQEKINLPKWVSLPTPKKRTTRNTDKLRKNQSAEAATTPAETNQMDDAGDAGEAETETFTPETTNGEETTSQASPKE